MSFHPVLEKINREVLVPHMLCFIHLTWKLAVSPRITRAKAMMYHKQFEWLHSRLPGVIFRYFKFLRLIAVYVFVQQECPSSRLRLTLLVYLDDISLFVVGIRET